MTTRRTFLGGTAAVSAGLIAGKWLGPRQAFAASLLTSAPALDPWTLTKFADPLPIPSVLRPTRKGPGGTDYEVTMTQFQQKLHKQLRPTTVWGYNGTYPGPTIEARTGEQVRVKWLNGLPDSHLFAVDHTIDSSPATLPDSRTVPHLHGGHAGPESDGHPLAWFTRAFRQTGPAFATRTYRYPNDQQAATLWYHDHAIGVTRLNVYAGLAGFYLIRDAVEDSLNLPSGKYEVPLVIQDRKFAADGELLYPAQWQLSFFGDTTLVNGKVWPFLSVQPRKYRFRILNGANFRNYNLMLFLRDASGNLTNVPGPIFNQIGSDGGLLSAPVPLANIPLDPAERADVVVDFSGFSGKEIVLVNGGPEAGAEVMLFKVAARSTSKDDSSLPSSLRPIDRLLESSAVRTRTMSLGFSGLKAVLNGVGFDAPVTENPVNGTTEIWSLFGANHPIHLHLVQFQILDKNGAPPPLNERGWKDTVSVVGLVRIIVPFQGTPGEYVWHCHMLEHEDNDMMRPYDLVS